MEMGKKAMGAAPSCGAAVGRSRSLPPPPLRTAAMAQGPVLSSALHDGQGTLLPWVSTELEFPPWKDQHIQEDAATDGRGSIRESASHCAAAE